MNTQNDIQILMVEDNPDDAELALRAFEKHKLANQVHWVKDGVKALDFIFARNQYSGRVNNDRPKLILLDLKLPKVDGLEVLRQIKSNEATKMIPVVVLTSSDEEEDMIESYNLGVNSYITKPVGFEKFVETVSKLGLYWLLLNQPLVQK